MPPPPRRQNYPENARRIPRNTINFCWIDRLGRLVGRSGRWIRERETEGVIERQTGNGGGAKRASALRRGPNIAEIGGISSDRKGPTPETQALAVQRVEAGRLKLERARLELAKVKGELIETEAAKRVFGDLIVYFRQRLLNLPGAVKTTLELSVAQTLGLQKDIRAALTELARGKPAPWHEAEERRRK